MRTELTHFKDFDTIEEYKEYMKNEPILPNVGFVDMDVYYKDGLPPLPFDEQYFTINILDCSPNSQLYFDSSGETLPIQVRINGGEWIEKQFAPQSSSNKLISVNPLDVIEFKGENASYYNCNISATKNIEVDVANNIMSLIYGDNFKNKTSFPEGSEMNFTYLFKAFNQNLKVFNAKDLCLPSTTLTRFCYLQFFGNCQTLITAPELPAKTLGDGCYNSMFMLCRNLTTAPELPATTLANRCYQNMFQACTSLVNAPKLPATTLASSCYNAMFNGCASLVNAPKLPATTLASSCYSDMFYGCRGLNYLKCLATDISAYDCTRNWLYGVSSAGTFVKNASMSGWTTGLSGIPNGWNVEDAS